MSTLPIQDPFTAFAATPDAPLSRAVIVVQEIYGLNREVRRVTQALAAQGFHAAAPDLLWRHRPGITFGYDERDAARAVLATLRPDDFVGDIAAAAQALKASSGATQLAIVTLGWGGRFGLQAANAAGATAVAAYYPGNLEGVEHLVGDVSAAQLYHFAGRDTRTPAPLRQAVREAAAGRDDVEVYVYPQADHGFANRDRSEFDATAAVLADRRTLDFLLAHTREASPAAAEA